MVEGGHDPGAQLGPRGGRVHRARPQHGIADQIDDLHFLPPVPGLGDVQPKTLEAAVDNGSPRQAVAGGRAEPARQQGHRADEAEPEKFGD